MAQNIPALGLYSFKSIKTRHDLCRWPIRTWEKGRDSRSLVEIQDTGNNFLMYVSSAWYAECHSWPWLKFESLSSLLEVSELQLDTLHTTS